MPLRIGPEVQALPRRLIWVAAASAAVVALALVGRGGIADPPPEPAPPEPAPSPTPAVAAGEWAELGEAPLSTPGEHRGVWTGAHLVVAGHRGELAAYDARRETWHAAVAAPIDLGTDPWLFWTGREVLVLGGRNGEVRTTGVAGYDPFGDSWRLLPETPAALRLQALGVWAGGRLLVWDRTRGLSFDPATDTWSAIQRIPVGWETVSAVWAGDHLLVWGTRLFMGDAPFAAAFDPATGGWEHVVRPWLHRPQDAAAVWTGEELLLWGRPRLIDGQDGPPAGFAYRPGEASWRWLPDVELDSPPGGLRAAWTDRGAVFLGAVPGRGVGLVYDGAWRRLPPGGGARLHPVVAWTGRELLVWGGHTTTGPSVDLVSWRPD